MKEATFKIKSVYGKDLIYPTNANAMLFSKLVKKKTMSGEDLKLIGMLGYSVTLN